MKLLNARARLTCQHITGQVDLILVQSFVTIEDSPVLRRADFGIKIIKGCSNAGPTIKPCNLTFPIYQGFSDLVFIEGDPVCLDTLAGLTDGTPPGIVEYIVRHPGQVFVGEE